MKNLVYLSFIIFLFSCKNETKKGVVETAQKPSIEYGKQLFESNNCVSCHQMDKKIIGPSLQEMAKIYQNKNGNFIAFLKDEADPIVDPSMYETMKINLQITKNMSDSDLKSLDLYLQSFSK